MTKGRCLNLNAVFEDCLDYSDLANGARFVEPMRTPCPLAFLIGKSAYIGSYSYAEATEFDLVEARRLAGRGYQLERVDHMSTVDWYRLATENGL